jgi:hypothetical protein
MRDAYVKRAVYDTLEQGDATVHDCAAAARVSVEHMSVKLAKMKANGEVHSAGYVPSPHPGKRACMLYRLGPAPT